jgi:hypothetical protein
MNFWQITFGAIMVLALLREICQRLIVQLRMAGLCLLQAVLTSAQRCVTMPTRFVTAQLQCVNAKKGLWDQIVQLIYVKQHGAVNMDTVLQGTLERLQNFL